MSALRECGLRSDGRAPEQARRIKVCGGAGFKVEQGNTVVSSVLAWDPYRPKKKGSRGLSATVRFMETSFQSPLSAMNMERKREEYERYLELVFNPVLLHHPEHRLEVAHTVKQEDGSLLPVMINATSVLLARSGVQLRHLLFSIKCGLVRSKEGSPELCIADLNRREEKSRIPSLVLAVPHGRDEIAFTLYENRAEAQDALKLLDFSMRNVRRVSDYFVDAVKTCQ